MKQIDVEDWGLVAYEEAWKRQTAFFDALVVAKRSKEPEFDRLIVCEHPPVYTIGRSGKENNMLLSDEQLTRLGASYFHIDRGGDVTFHGPGQLVCYPIIDLEHYGFGLKAYVNVLEEAVIRVCESYGIGAGRVEGATGVWVDGQSSLARKICAIGIRCSHYCTMHGLAFNLNVDLRYFSYINPCGFVDKGVTSLKQELGMEVNMEEVKQRLLKNLIKLLNNED